LKELSSLNSLEKLNSPLRNSTPFRGTLFGETSFGGTHISELIGVT